MQEPLHLEAIKSDGKLVSPLPFPLATFEAEKIKPGRSHLAHRLDSNQRRFYWGLSHRPQRADLVSQETT
jgi:hypothetical protein